MCDFYDDALEIKYKSEHYFDWKHVNGKKKKTLLMIEIIIPFTPNLKNVKVLNLKNFDHVWRIFSKYVVLSYY